MSRISWVLGVSGLLTLAACGGAQEEAAVDEVAEIAGALEVGTLYLDQAVTGLSAAKGGGFVYRLANAPAGKRVLVSVSGGIGNADLCAIRDLAATSCERLSERADNNDYLSLPIEEGWDWYIAVLGAADFAGARLLAEIDASLQLPSPVLPLPSVFEVAFGEETPPFAGRKGEWTYFKVTGLPSGKTKLLISLSGTGATELYTRQGQRPTLTRYDTRTEHDDLGLFVAPWVDPAEGTVFVGIYGVTDFSGAVLRISEDKPLPQPGPVGPWL